MSLVVFIMSFSLIFAGAIFAKNDFNLIKAKGTVSLSDIGGKGLYVFSMWDASKNSFVKADGSFVTVISNSRAQKISVKDHKKAIRALAIVLPQSPDNIIFDAESTAMAVLLSDASLFRNSMDMEKFYKKAATKKSFQDFVVFLKKSLPLKSLEALTGDDEYVALVRACNKEIFNEDDAAIKKSLYQAREQLEKSLQ
jgi:hypothetical protein